MYFQPRPPPSGALLPPGYEPRCPRQTALFRILARHLEEFLARTDEATYGNGLPRFVKRELRDFLGCGDLERGFARVYCPTCGDDVLVGYTCKGRGVCPTCGGRRMSDTAAHLVDRVIPPVPCRQFVLTLPWPLRLALAYDAELTSAVLAVFIRAVNGYYRDLAKQRSIPGVEAIGGSQGIRVKTGSVTSLHRAGSALNLNLHMHVLFLDGVYYQLEPGATVRFQPLIRHRNADIRALVRTVQHRVLRLLRRRGLLPADDQDGADDPQDGQSSLLERLTELSVAGLTPTGARPTRAGATRPRSPRAGRAKRTCNKYSNHGRQPLCHSTHGFNLHARTRVAASRRGDLEVLCRYLLKPAVTYDQVELCEDGRVAWQLRRPWRDGTALLYFDPLAFIARLAPLVPPPRKHQIRYHGVLAPNAKWRAQVVASAPTARGVPRSRSARCGATQSTAARPRRLSWHQLLHRTFGFDILLCYRCGGRRALISFIQDPSVAHRILHHLGLTTAARPPPRFACSVTPTAHLGLFRPSLSAPPPPPP